MSLEVKEILIAPAPSLTQVAGGKGLLGDKIIAPIKLNAELLRNNLSSFIQAVNEALAGLPVIAEPFKLEEIELVVEVNAEGSLQLVGGVKAGASGGITLKLKR
jgi:hypothetical protein